MKTVVINCRTTHLSLNYSHTRQLDLLLSAILGKKITFYLSVLFVGYSSFPINFHCNPTISDWYDARTLQHGCWCFFEPSGESHDIFWISRFGNASCWLLGHLNLFKRLVLDVTDYGYGSRLTLAVHSRGILCTGTVWTSLVHCSLRQRAVKTDHRTGHLHFRLLPFIRACWTLRVDSSKICKL